MSIGIRCRLDLDFKTALKTLYSINENAGLKNDELVNLVGVNFPKIRAYKNLLRVLGLYVSKNVTQIGNYILLNDRYLDNTLTKWLLHYQLARNREAEVWYHLTNKFIPKLSEFTKEQAMSALIENGIGTNVSKAKFEHFKDDVMFFIDKAFSEENNLAGIGYLSKESGKYKKTNPLQLHHLLIAYILFDQRKENYPEVKTVSINELLIADGNVGKVCLLNRENLEKFLYQLQGMGYLVVSKFADLDQVAFKFEGDPLEILEEYYKSMK